MFLLLCFYYYYYNNYYYHYGDNINNNSINNSLLSWLLLVVIVVCMYVCIECKRSIALVNIRHSKHLLSWIFGLYVIHTFYCDKFQSITWTDTRVRKVLSFKKKNKGEKMKCVEQINSRTKGGTWKLLIRWQWKASAVHFSLWGGNKLEATSAFCV